MESICKMQNCIKCESYEKCGGCAKNNGKPFGNECCAAEIINYSGYNSFLELKQTLIKEINELNIEDLKLLDLNLVNGDFLNIEYLLPNGEKTKFLKDNKIYFANQIEIKDSKFCYGVACDEKFILIAKYNNNCEKTELILFKKRKIK